MNETEQRLSSTEEKKEKIRQRYKGVGEDQLSVIPAVPKPDIFDHDRKLRVAVYARVSTDDPNQTSSYELQKNHYTDLVNMNPNWDLVDIYADEGISGTSLQHRDNFVRMISDCEAGLIDLIVTKSVSRFARNLLDGVGFVRKLGAMTPPVGVFFETENINTFKSESEMSLAIVSTMAQEESHTKSEIMNASVEMRFKRGIFLTPALLGYDQDENGNLIINEEEAKTVRLIFFMYIYGYTCQQIADALTKLKRKTKKGNTTWYGSSVMAQLTNERHCGAVLARKTFTPNYLDHKSKKNRKDRNQYFQAEHHDPIISRKDFIYVQHLIQYAKNGNVNILPELHVIPDGLLAGYVTINPRWVGFKPTDYLAACESISIDSMDDDEPTVTVEEGDFDLRGYEIVRSQYFNVANRLAINISPVKMKFSTSCLRKIDSTHVEVLVHPLKRMIAVRATSDENRLAFHWMRKKDGISIPRDIAISAIAPCLFSLVGWNFENRHRIYGTSIQSGDATVILFNAADSEVFISKETSDEEADSSFDATGKRSKKTLTAYPASWEEGFGVEYYSHKRTYESIAHQQHDPVIISTEAVVYNPRPSLEVPDPQIIADQIQSVLNEIKTEEATT